MRVRYDLETRSRVDLKKMGPYRYVVCPDFRILLAGWSTGGEVEVDENQADAVMRFWDYWHSGAEFVAHNAAFDRIAMSAAVGLPPGTYLDPERFEDTAARSAEHGYPRSLAGVAKALGAEDKDEAGQTLINFFCKPITTGKLKGQFRRPRDYPEKWAEFRAYLVQDVASLNQVDDLLEPWPTAMERRVFMADQRINDRGMRIDLDLAERAKVAAALNAEEQKARVTEISGVLNPNSLPQMKAFLESAGQPIKDMKAETVEAFLERKDLTPVVREVMELRQELALTASKKFTSALDQQVGGVLRGNLRFFGAHTGRWSGKGTQPHNLPRLSFEDEEINGKKIKGTGIIQQQIVIGELLAGGRASAEDLKRCVRAMFLGPMTGLDYSSIEAIVIAWLAGEQWVLDAARSGRDLYVETAERMGGLTRAQGKIAVLALGYNGGANSIRALDSKGDFDHLTDEQIRKTLVLPWRKANPRTVALWASLQNAFGEGGHAGPKLRVTKGSDRMGHVRRIHLPSGRAITYHGVKWERYSIVDKKTGKKSFKEGFRYTDPGNPNSYAARIGTYGGRLSENATQAVARDIMAESLVRLEENGYDVFAHVHDEILLNGHHPIPEIKRIMTKNPRWAAGLPINADGMQMNRYQKM